MIKLGAWWDYGPRQGQKGRTHVAIFNKIDP